MKRNDAIRWGMLGLLVAVVLGGLFLFQFRVRIAGLKYLLLLAIVVGVAWWIGRRRG